MDEVSGADPRPRAMGRWPDAALAAAAAFIVTNVVLLVAAWPRGDEPWAVGHMIILGAATMIRARRPELAVSAWSAFSVLAATAGELCNTILSALLDGDAAAHPIAAATAIGLGAGALGGAATVTLLAVYPDDQPLVRRERNVLRAVWLLVSVPIIVVLGASEIPIPSYVGDGAAIANPFHILPFAISSGAVDGVTGLNLLTLLGGVSILVAHYRRADVGVRRQIRWLLVPFPFVVFAIALEAMLGESGHVVVWLLFVFLNPAIPLAWTIGILQPDGWDADKVLRRSLVYGILWIAIVGTLVGTAAVAGTTVGRYVPIGWAIVIAIVISLVFQPLRRRLESLAARWVFGERVDHSGVITNLGATLAQTFDLERLLPRMVTALEEGLQLTWAQVSLHGTADVDAPGEPELVVPIELDGEHLGVVECGAKRDGPWTDDDRAVVATFARQAALAVRNVRLTEQTARYAAAVEDSRSRIARAAESERRRIERNIHDGIQQDLVVLLAAAGRIQEEPDPAAMSAGMIEIRRRLERVLGDLRDLARGIYPSVLSDQGILPAVEALVATHPHPVRLRADADLRQLRLPEEIEGAAYFTVAEALTNSLKHADACDIEVTLSRVNGSLMIEVADDGVGFDPTQPAGRGLEGLADRLGALGGTFVVDAEAGRGTVVHASLAITHGIGS